MTSIISNLSMFVGKISYLVAKKMGKKGTALPGKVALKLNPSLLEDVSKKCNRTIMITGTNGKTTTNNLLNHVLNGSFKNIASNLNGSNMIQGVVTPFITNSKKTYDWGVFEVDEGSVPKVSQFLSPDYFIITNFFRDQLDRYGEVENTIKMVHDSIKPETTLIINADDPSLLRFDDLPNKKIYYSFDENSFSKTDVTVAESVFCPKCGKRLNYEYINYGNIGKFSCPKCGAKNPEPDYSISSVQLREGVYDFVISHNGENEGLTLNLMGMYNLYNCLAVITLAKEIGLDYNMIKHQIETFEYKLGRMETISFKNKDVILVLSKNPIGLSEVFSTFTYDNNEKTVMFILNDYGPDGKDISWIWDANFEEVSNMQNLKKFYCVGTRAEDAALRLKYADFENYDDIVIYPSKNQFDIDDAIEDILSENTKSYIVGTFTAMPEARKYLLKKQKEGY